MSYIEYTKNMKGNVFLQNPNNSIIEREKRKNNYYDNKPYDKTKTQFCKSLNDGLKCKYGDNCYYAHSISEIRIKMCNYPDTCYKVYLNDKGKFYNCDKQKCRFLHSYETKENYIKRLGIYYKKSIKEDDELNKTIKISKEEHELDKIIKISKEEHELDKAFKIIKEEEELDKAIKISKDEEEKSIKNILKLFDNVCLEEKYPDGSDDESDDDIEIILDNPEILKKIWEKNKYYKTQYCKKEDCKNNRVCDFAHSKEDLRICKCSYFQNCIHIGRKLNGECYNENGKICKFLHWGESKEEYFLRTGM